MQIWDGQCNSRKVCQNDAFWDPKNDALLALKGGFGIALRWARFAMFLRESLWAPFGIHCRPFSVLFWDEWGSFFGAECRDDFSNCLRTPNIVNVFEYLFFVWVSADGWLSCPRDHVVKSFLWVQHVVCILALRVLVSKIYNTEPVTSIPLTQ